MFLPWDKGQPKETQGIWYCHLSERKREKEREKGRKREKKIGRERKR
jgi:hypothetical protein